MKLATCSCGFQAFIITETFVKCSNCGKQFNYKFICDGICETKADDIVILVNEGY